MGDPFNRRMKNNKMSLHHLDLDDWEPAEGEHPTWSMEEIENHPLFMTELKGDIEGNEAVQALQAALYEDETPESLCENFKNQGNDAVRRGLLDDAIIFYHEALDTECKESTMLSQIHSNLALVQLKKLNYPECVNECYRAIGFDATNSKAFYRGARASLALELYAQGIYFAKGGVSADPTNEDMVSVLSELEAAKATQDALKAKHAAAEDPPKPKLKYRWRD
jgi:tetratricopeptide (TPR) repeat protein